MLRPVFLSSVSALPLLVQRVRPSTGLTIELLSLVAMSAMGGKRPLATLPHRRPGQAGMTLRPARGGGPRAVCNRPISCDRALPGPWALARQLDVDSFDCLSGAAPPTRPAWPTLRYSAVRFRSQSQAARSVAKGTSWSFLSSRKQAKAWSCPRPADIRRIPRRTPIANEPKRTKKLGIARLCTRRGHVGFEQDFGV